MNRNLLFSALMLVAAIKLPYESGQRFVVVQGYDSPPTHVNKDLYAVDFSQAGCDEYGELAVAASPGTVMLAQQAGYNGGYGTQVLIVDASRIVARYAHLIPRSLTVTAGDAVVQGEPLGEIGNTGLVAGDACPAHPGAHLHFAMYGENADGSFSPFRPEPISTYVGITAGRWYLSDNALALATVPGAEVALQRAAATLFGANGNEGVEANGGLVLGAASSSQPQQSAPSSSPPSSFVAIPSGGVAVSVPPPATQITPQDNISSTAPALALAPAPTPSTSTPPAITITNASFNSSTLAVDLAWQAPSGTMAYQIFSSSTLVATTTMTHFSYPLEPTDFDTALQFTIALASTTDPLLASLSTIATVVPSISLPDWWTVIQPRDDSNSNGSWYEDNWYNLGTGFYGTIRSLTLEGAVDNSSYFASSVSLAEYLDANYTQLNQTWMLSDNAPFTNGTRFITLGGLNIPLQPNKYYRLLTFQAYQNRSVILAGTTATGTAMWNEFIGGIGRVEHAYPFYPYLAAVMIPNYPPLAAPNPVATATVSFDAPNSALNISWPATTDPDTTSSLLTYEVNVATSSSDDAWQSVGKHLATTVPVVYGNSYLVGFRAVDDFGNTSTPLIVPWSFPADYFPVPEQLEADGRLPDGGAQSIVFPGPITISSMGFWINSDPDSQWREATSFVDVRADASGTPGGEVASSSWVTIGHGDWTGERTYPFSPSITLPAGMYWFSVAPAPVDHNASTHVFGSSGDTYVGGQWSTASGQDAFFRITE